MYRMFLRIKGIYFFHNSKAGCKVNLCDHWMEPTLIVNSYWLDINFHCLLKELHREQ